MDCCNVSKAKQYDTESEMNTENSQSSIISSTNDVYKKSFPKFQKKIKLPLPPKSNKKMLKHIVKIQSAMRMFLTKKAFLSNLNHTKKMINQKLIYYSIENPQDFIDTNTAEKLYKIFKEIYPNELIIFNESANYNVLTSIPMSEYIINLYKNEYYLGSWNINSQYHGYGVLFIRRKNCFERLEGVFKNGKLQGLGCGIYTNSNTVFIGQYSNSLANGSGREFYIEQNDNNPTRFQGKFFDGNKVYGSLLWNDGSYYKGNFNYDQKFHGNGTFFWQNTNEMYEGDWHNGLMNGIGKMTYSDGSYYQGSFKDNKKCGRGSYHWKEDGKYLVGDWKDDNIQGKAVFNYKGKSQYLIFKDGKVMKDK